MQGIKTYMYVKESKKRKQGKDTVHEQRFHIKAFYIIRFYLYFILTTTLIFSTVSVSLLLYFDAACPVLMLTQLCHFPINKQNSA